MNMAISIIIITVLFSTILGIYAGRRVKMNLEMWTVGGRQFGVAIMWILMAGELYTTFTFLGAAGWIYSKGAPAYYILIYITLAYVISFFILPSLWEAGNKFGMHTVPDFFTTCYGNRFLGIIVAVIGIVSILPYLQLQLTGLGIIVQVASNNVISANKAILISFMLTCVFVLASGIRGIAWVSIVKNIMMISAVGIIGIGIPWHYYGGIGKMFHVLIDEKAYHLIFPGSTTNYNSLWVMSTVLLTSAGFYMWPHSFGSVFSARNANILRRNAIIMPFYQIPLLLIFCVGFTAMLVIPGLNNSDMALLELVKRTFPEWLLGFVGAAGAVTAMVPAAILVLSASTLFSKNIYKDGFNPKASGTSIVNLSRIMAIIITAAALFFSITQPSTLVRLLLIGFDGVAQFFPGVVLGLFWKRITANATITGMIAGICTVLILIVTKQDPFHGLNAGFLALSINFLIVIVMSNFSRKKPLDSSFSEIVTNLQ